MIDSSMFDEEPVRWPKDLPQLKNLDDRLRCPICYEHMKNPVISTGCTHSFCSLCIRNYIAVKNSCPICFGDITDGMLRSFRCMEEIIKCFIAIKAYLLKSLRNDAAPAATPVERSNVASKDPEPSPSTSVSPVIGSQSKTSRGPTRKAARDSEKSVASKHPAPSQTSSGSNGVHYTEDFQSPKRTVPETQRKAPATPAQAAVPAPSNEVQCPVCQASMRESVINTHLDACLSKKQEKRKPMPKLIYNLMKDAELKKRLREAGLSATGDRNALVNRHKKYTILYNSECDSANPRPVIELRAQLEREEAESRRLAQAEPRLTSPRVKKPDPETIEKENQQYVQNNKDSFEQLIRDVKARQQQLKAAQAKARSQQQTDQQSDLALPSTSSAAQSENESTSEQCAPDPTPAAAAAEEKEQEKVTTGTPVTNDDDEITVLPTPVKVYETVSLDDDSDEETPSTSRNFTSIKRRVLSESEKSTCHTSEDSASTFPDPMASSASGKSTPRWTDNSSSAWSPSISYSPLDETVTNDYRDSEDSRQSARRPSSPSYSPLDDSSSPDMFKRESSSSGCSTPVNPGDSRRRPIKRNKSQMADGSSEKRKSSRRRI